MKATLAKANVAETKVMTALEFLKQRSEVVDSYSLIINNQNPDVLFETSCIQGLIEVKSPFYYPLPKPQRDGYPFWRQPYDWVTAITHPPHEVTIKSGEHKGKKHTVGKVWDSPYYEIRNSGKNVWDKEQGKQVWRNERVRVNIDALYRFYVATDIPGYDPPYTPDAWVELERFFGPDNIILFSHPFIPPPPFNDSLYDLSVMWLPASLEDSIKKAEKRG